MTNTVWALVFIAMKMGAWQPEAGTLNVYSTMDECFVAREIAIHNVKIQSSQAICIRVNTQES